MNRRNLSCSVFALLLLFGVSLHSQNQSDPPPSVTPLESAPAKPSKSQFFAGLVMEADASHVTVSRNLVGRPIETRIFALDTKTKTPKGGIKVKSRVTVRYQHMPGRDLALEIEVRPSSRTPKVS